MLQRLQQICVYFLAIVFALLVVLAVVMWQSSTVVEGTLSIPNLTQKVIIDRDDKGFVTIKAQNELDSYRAWGFATAQDRLLQIMLMRQMFQGRLSEVMGPKSINIDRYMRYLDIEKASKESFNKLDKRVQDAFRAYAQGVNAYLDQRPLPVMFVMMGFKPRHWMPWDSVLIQKVISWDLTNNFSMKYANARARSQYGVDALMNFYPKAKDRNPTISHKELIASSLPQTKEITRYPVGDVFNKAQLDVFKEFIGLDRLVLTALGTDITRSPGSNAWAVHGSITNSGHPQIATDPHLHLASPNAFHLVSIEYPGYKMTGGAIPGGPVIIEGHNSHVAWGFTNAHADQSDLFLCRKNCASGQKYPQRIAVKGADDYTFTIERTPEGTVVGEGENGLKGMLQWSGASYDDTTLEAVFYLNHSQNVEDARSIMKEKWDTPSQNMIIIDDKNIAYQLLGSIPVRKYSGQVPVFSDAYSWGDTIPRSELPFLVNPQKKYVANSNNLVVDEHYKYNLTGMTYDDLRQPRLDLLLQQYGQSTKFANVDSQHQHQTDTFEGSWPIFRGFFQENYALTSQSTDLEKAALKLLQEWDGHADLDKVGITIWSQWLRRISQRLYAEVNRPFRDQANQDASDDPTSGKGFFSREIVYNDLFVYQQLKDNGRFTKQLPSDDFVGSENSVDLMTKTFKEAIQDLRTVLGDNPNEWTWERVHFTEFQNPLAKSGVEVIRRWVNRTLATPGSRDSLNRARWFSEGTPSPSFSSKEGACIRMVADSFNLNEADFMMPMGQSENPFFSRHYDDLNDDWAHGKYIRFTSRKSKHHVLTLLPQTS